MSFSAGNSKDGYHYWLTPEDLYKKLDAEFKFDFDPCPYPLPRHFDGLTLEWGQSNFVNPPFGRYLNERGKVQGITIWARKAVMEAKKGKTVVFLGPCYRWVMELFQAGFTCVSAGDVSWEAIEDRTKSKDAGPIGCIIYRPGDHVPLENEKQLKLFDI